MIVVSDNSALSALAEAGLTDLLPRLFGTVVIPEAVYRETLHPRAPGLLREWSKLPPEWLKVVPNPTNLLAETEGLGPGEAAAITLAWENRSASRLILDEKRGRRVAEALGFRTSSAQRRDATATYRCGRPLARALIKRAGQFKGW